MNTLLEMSNQGFPSQIKNFSIVKLDANKGSLFQLILIFANDECCTFILNSQEIKNLVKNHSKDIPLIKYLSQNLKSLV